MIVHFLSTVSGFVTVRVSEIGVSAASGVYRLTAPSLPLVPPSTRLRVADGYLYQTPRRSNTAQYARSAIVTLSWRREVSQNTNTRVAEIRTGTDIIRLVHRVDWVHTATYHTCCTWVQTVTYLSCGTRVQTVTYLTCSTWVQTVIYLTCSTWVQTVTYLTCGTRVQIATYLSLLS